MERPTSALRQRIISFNPEAAAFNPEFRTPTPRDIGFVSPTKAETPHSTFSKAPMFNHSPFKSDGSLHSLYLRDSLTPAPVCLENFFSHDLQAMVKNLEEYPNVQEILASHAPETEPVVGSEPAAEPILNPPSLTSPTQQPQLNYITVDIKELSASLGLPTVKAGSNDEESAAASSKSRVSQAHPGALYGKLIGWALDKPLTARGLAEFLQEKELNPSSEPPGPESISELRPQNVESNLPQPNFKPALEKEASTHYHRPVSVSIQMIPIPTGPSALQHQRRHNSASYRHHARVPSNRRYNRRASRAKRMDQGPMPSVADIYPDDAHWRPGSMCESLGHVTYHDKPFRQSETVLGNVFNWPPPAQVYRPEPAPNAADIDAADNDVLALMDELPEPSLDTLARLGNSHDLRISTTFDLPCDERALTPAQEDGSRYGMRFYGLAYGDQWELPKAGGFGEIGHSKIWSRAPDGCDDAE